LVVQHIIHNAAKKGLETLSIDVQLIIMKIYNHFSVYTVQTEELKEFCEFVDIEYRQLLYNALAIINSWFKSRFTNVSRPKVLFFV